jgi:hypothetical protein
MKSTAFTSSFLGIFSVLLFLGLGGNLKPCYGQPFPITVSSNSHRMAEIAYEHQKLERSADKIVMMDKLARVAATGSNWPCLWGSEATGDAGPVVVDDVTHKPSWKHTCGLARLGSQCVVYSFHNHGNYGFERGVLLTNPSCNIHLFDNADVSQEQLNKWFPSSVERVSFHKISEGVDLLSSTKVKELMARNQHMHVDLLYVKVMGNHKMLREDWPSVGQVLMDVFHIHEFPVLMSSMEQHNFRLFHKRLHADDKVSQVIALSWIQKSWMPRKTAGDTNIDQRQQSRYDEEVANRIKIAEFTYQNQIGERSRGHNNVYSSIGSNWPCFGTEEVVGTLDTWLKHWDQYKDGWKFSCGLTDTASPSSQSNSSCAIYSLGSAGNMAFEQDLLRKRPDCKIYIFDKDSFGLNRWFSDTEISKSVTFTKAFISDRNDNTVDPPLRTIESIMQQYGHTHIDLLKMDIEGAEFEILGGDKKLPSVGQLLVEVHLSNVPHTQYLDKYGSLLNNIEKNGLRLYHKEPNFRYDFNCIELAFMHKDWVPSQLN